MKFGIFLIPVITAIAINAGAQSLSEIARQERERQYRTVSTRVFTNETLPDLRPGPTSRSPAPAGAASDEPVAEPAELTAADAGPTAGGSNEEQWRKMFADAREAVTDLGQELRRAGGPAGWGRG